MRWLFVMVTAVWLVGCGGGGGGGSDEATDATDTTMREPVPATSDTTVAEAATEATADLAGRVRRHPEAGLSIYWPGGCDRVLLSESDGQTRHAAREVILSCQLEGIAYSVRYLELARDAQGDPAHPRFVVALIEEQLSRKSLRTLRQRPLADGAIQGVDVQAEAQDRRQFAWYRGLLVGTDVYLLLALGDSEDLFTDPETRDFFYSLDLQGG